LLIKYFTRHTSIADGNIKAVQCGVCSRNFQCLFIRIINWC